MSSRENNKWNKKNPSEKIVNEVVPLTSGLVTDDTVHLIQMCQLELGGDGRDAKCHGGVTSMGARWITGMITKGGAGG